MSKFQLDTKNIWFPDQKEPVYDPNDYISDMQFKAYWIREKDRLLNGFTLADNQVYIPGFLYWHTVYWKIAMYIENSKNGRKSRVVDTPLLRDIEWDISNDFEECLNQGKFYNLVGSRDFGKSILAASRAAWTYTLFSNSEVVISSSEYNYMKLATDKIEDGLTTLHPMWKKQRITSDWKKEIKAGWKDKKTGLPSEKSSNSKILMRNYEHGNKTMAANGTRPSFHLIDEEGTLENLIGCLKDSDGCWWSGGGLKPSCLVMLTGTGGDMDKGAEAGEVFFNPAGYNMLEFEDTWENTGKIGRFISALRARHTFKEPMPLSQYLGIDHPDLDRITILVSNQERAKTEWWDVEYAKALKTGNSKAILKFKAYWPLKPSDSFIVLSQNDFNTDAAKEQLKKLKGMEAGTPVELYMDGNKICHRFSKKMPITEFPLKTQSPDAPVVIYEFPMFDAPMGTYTAGVDSYRQESAEESASLGSVYIYKRMHNILGEGYQEMLVASYSARPNNKKDWEEQARMLIKYYNAQALVENDEISFIDYMISKNDDHYLSDQPDFQKVVTPNSKLNRKKGVSRQAKSMIFFLHGKFKDYLDEVIATGIDENGQTYEILGITRILDPMLLEEIIKFNAKKGNYDRIVAAELAIVQAWSMDPIFGKAESVDQDTRRKAYFNKNKKSAGVFSGMRNPFGSRKIKLF